MTLIQAIQAAIDSVGRGNDFWIFRTSWPPQLKIKFGFSDRYEIFLQFVPTGGIAFNVPWPGFDFSGQYGGTDWNWSA